MRRHRTRGTWRVINPFFLRHRLNFVKNLLYYDDIFWDCRKSRMLSIDIKFFLDALLDFKAFVADFNFLDTSPVFLLEKIGAKVGTHIRDEKDSGIYTPWGYLAPRGNQFIQELEKWHRLTIKAIINKDVEKQWEVLLTLENLVPWEQYNGFLAKITWNFVRNQIGIPLAYVPIEQKAMFYKELLVFSDKII